MDKKGYALIYVLGLIALMIFLVATLTNFTMQRAYSVNRNIYDVKKRSEAEMAVQSASMELINHFELLNSTYTEVQKMDDLVNDLNSRFLEIETQYSVTIRDLTQEPCNYPSEASPCYSYDADSHTRSFDIIYTDGEIVAQRKFFLSNIPSFLFFALGSRTDMTINGGAYIDGDIYTNNNIYLSNSLNYIHNGILAREDTAYASMLRNLYVNQNIYFCKETVNTNCYDYKEPNIYSRNNFNQIKHESEFRTFLTTPPKVLDYKERFLDVDINPSVIYYLKETISDSTFTLDNDNLRDDLNTKFNDSTQTWLYEAQNPNEINDQDSQSVVINSPTSLTSSVYFNNERWILINGDLTIRNRQLKEINIDANIIVNGDLMITGNVSFDSTIYVLGETIIDDASILGDSDNQLVLISKENIQISKINDFNNSFSGFNGEEIKPDIKGYFYSDSHIELYAVASYIVIEGGLFASDSSNHDNGIVHSEPSTFIPNTDDSIGFMMNVFRGSVSTDGDTINFTDSSDIRQSRFIIKHSQEILSDQPKGLPVNSQFIYLFDDIIIY